MLLGALTVLLALLSRTESKQKDVYTFKVVNSRGKLVSLEKYRGSVSLRRTAEFWRTSSSFTNHTSGLHVWMLHVYFPSPLSRSVSFVDVKSN